MPRRSGSFRCSDQRSEPPDPAERAASVEFFRDMLELASRLHAPGLTILPGIDWDDEGHEASLAHCCAQPFVVHTEPLGQLDAPVHACVVGAGTSRTGDGQYPRRVPSNPLLRRPKFAGKSRGRPGEKREP